MPRAHDQVLADVVREAAGGGSRMLVLVGSSSTGKTRACWEAVQPLDAHGWRLWHPFDPTRADAALEGLHQVSPRTVVWLNEAQNYFDDSRSGERIAAALHTLLTDPGRGPVLVLGTLWNEFADKYAALPIPGLPDLHSRVREILAGRILAVPDTFDEEALSVTAALAQGGDALLEDALGRAKAHGRLAQELAGATELQRRYDNGTPAVRALLEAAMDARRLGVGLRLPQSFLTEAAVDYLSDHDYDRLGDDWPAHAYTELARSVHGHQPPLYESALRPVRRPDSAAPDTATAPGLTAPAGPLMRLADYLEQHGRLARGSLCPPASFWAAANIFLTRPEDLRNLAVAAEQRHRLQWADALRGKAARSGDTTALMEMAQCLRRARDWEGAERLALRAAEAGEVHAWTLASWIREEAGDLAGALHFMRCAAEAGAAMAWSHLATLQERVGDRQGAEKSARIAEAHDVGIWSSLATYRGIVGDWEGAEEYARRSTDAGYPMAWSGLVFLCQGLGQLEQAERFARLGAEAGEFGSWALLAQLQAAAGDITGAEDSMQRSAGLGNLAAHSSLTALRHEAGDLPGAQAAAQQSADLGMPDAWLSLALLRARAGDRDAVEDCARRLEESEHPDAWGALIRLWQMTGDPEKAEAAARKAAGAGHLDARIHLVRLRHAAGDMEGALRQARHLADSGHAATLTEQPVSVNELWPNGLDADGTPTPPWQPCQVTFDE
ncbi:hypothetical protein OHA84_36740 [Streptomyces sp. NBC_00513]|uniref:hypothetical protein n=1 Tax=unclassified Streptomyces TaxID=2593676 RepID=UPI00225AB28B|nr:hypothetical protein [Streptomyces sp. NBC_00424]MCX5078675.1 hypothetical protein [Streptomyces sp. NBC_00424]WUD39118.1 hypothetical protein OHA84_00560 [Streptomyces sp. NBC_00513]WUD45611.1 hypothetical protein OHA84_36740 [Streptomyces sp. NBC_00513]